MIPLFENAGLIGLGLIGGSLARAMKKNGLAKTVTGYTKSPESCKRALQLGIIDNIADSISKLAEKSDIIIISTPLSSYGDIAQEISKSIQENCIITDVGSLKAPCIDIFSEYLPKKNLRFLVPAHPIAGTEKTGVESGFAELFEGKKVIITPLPNTSHDATDKVNKLWHSCGSSTQILEAGRHDRIYAEVSHLPQFLAFCYAEFLRQNHNDNNFKADDRFWKWSRICASDPIIWLDIFRMNKNNLLDVLDDFINHLMKAATLHFSLPALISSTLIKCSPHAEEFSGSGFKDFTSYKDSEVSKTDGIEFTDKFVAITQILADSIRNNNPTEALEFMQGASGWYRKFLDSTSS